MHWLVYEPNEESLNKLVNSAANYEPQTFKDLINQFDFEQFDNEKKLSIEQKLWTKLDKEKNSDSYNYKNLLELDNKLFTSLRPNDILH